MLLEHSNGSVAIPNLKELQEQRIPEHRNTLEKSHVDLDALATHCERKYLHASDREKQLVYEETKNYALQSLAGVAYQINNLARDLSDMLTLQVGKIERQAHNIDNLNLVVNIQKEKMARREIGALTASKSIPKLPKITMPQIQEPLVRYKRVPIDFTVLDGVGHGTRTEPPKQPLVSRAPSSVSSANNYGHLPYERLAQIGGTATLSRGSIRSGVTGEHYRIPSVMGPYDGGRYASQAHGGSDYGAMSVGTPAGTDYGSQHGSSEYGGRYQDHISDKYGTIRGHHMRPQFDLMETERRAPSPGLPPPPPQLSNYDYGTINKPRNDLPPPAAHMLNSTHEDDLPPPPGSDYYSHPTPHSNYFDVRADWIPQEGTFIEKAIAIYDYESEKPDELSLRENCIIYVLRKNEDGWYEGILDGVTGLFPGNYVRSL